MKRYFESLIELIFPTYCLCCGQYGELICTDCLDLLPLNGSSICQKCGKPSLCLVESCRECRKKRFLFDQARSLGLYQNGLKELVRCFKYGGSKRLADVFSKLIIERIDDGFFDIDYITYVPLSSKKKHERGFNQAQLLAKCLADDLDLQLVDVLKQDRETKDQSKLPAADRKTNVKGAYSVRKDVLPGGCRVLLVDDVFTTGSTVSECSRVLKSSGAELVKVITIARATNP